jgi:hypothetical protein
MQRKQFYMTSASAAVVAIALAVAPTPVLAAEPATHGRPHASAAATRTSRSGEPDDSGSLGSVSTRTSGSDDGGSDDSFTTRTSRMKPVGGVGPLLGGGSQSSGATPPGHSRHHTKRARTRTSGAANGSGDD